MKSTVPCPSDLALEQYVLGELGPSHADVGDHVAACPICRAKAADKAAHNVTFKRAPGAEMIRSALSLREQAMTPSPSPGRAPPVSTPLAELPTARRHRIIGALGFAAALALAFAL